VYSFDDYLEYAMDVPDQQRDELLAELDRSDPPLGAKLREALERLVTNRDFVCQTAPKPVDADARDRVRHVTLPVDDLDRAVRWYTRTFRCELVIQEGDRAVLAFDGSEVHLVAAGRDAPRLTVQRPDVAGMGPSTRRPDGVRGLHLTDPWGNVIEVVDGPATA